VNVLDLFSGIGGFSLGLERAGAFHTVAFCEREPFCQAVLGKHWPDTPIYDDVRTIPTDRLGGIDLICGGFPCQPWSLAGQQRGAEDDRDLWPAMAALVEELRPTYVIGENVRGFVNEPLGLQRSLSDLESLGYEAAAFVIPACAVDAPHRRDRVWIVANCDLRRQLEPINSKKRGKGVEAREPSRNSTHTVADSSQQSARREEQGQYRKGRRGDAATTGEAVADAENAGLEGRCVSGNARKEQPRFRQGSRPISDDWLPEPGVGRVADGVPRRVDRLKALGNAVVPQVVEQIGRAIMEASDE
jgi:DNA (cytosine-5)-methyltransferase 1